MTVLRYLPVLGLGLLFSVRTSAQQMKLGLQPTLLKKEALLELNSDSQGLLLNRVPKSAISAGGPLFNATDGMFVYVTDPGEKCLYIKANGAWKKVADFSGITTDNIPEGTTNLYFTQARARAAFSAGNGINIGATGVISNTGVLTFAGRTPDAAGNIAPAATDYASFYLPWASKLTLTAGTGMKTTTTATKDLNTNPAFTIDADNGSAIWNANKLASVPVSTTAPATNQVLTFNGTQWEPKAPTGATGNFINNGTSLQAGASFNISGTGDIGSNLQVAGNSLMMGKLTLNSLALATPGASNGKVLSLNATGDVIVTQTLPGTRKIKLVAGSGVINFGAAGEQDLSADRTWQISVDSAKNIWNANKIQNNAVATTAPADGDVLKWNAATQMYIPAEDITGGASYGTLSSRDIRNADAPDERYRMKIWQGPSPSATGAGTVQNGPLGTSAYAWSVLAFRSGDYTTHLYFDKNTLAIREWEGSQKPLTPNAGPPLNPWYKVVTTYGDNSFTAGGLLFGYKTSDASTETAQDAGNLYWDNSSKELGLGTNNPQATLDVNGDFKMGANGTVFNGMFKFQMNLNIGSFARQTQTYADFTVPSGTPSLVTNATVILNPVDEMTGSVSVSWVKVISSTRIRVGFINIGNSNASLSSTRFNVTIIQ
ncbi:hypothetical protein SAMN04488128_1058 [Chitinophaga eiseniae]|uniref:Uncharacterized protein n=1 Tax=Chitinophaga eiseniae TaxID=634771 RepID=A0A1T4TGA1_9BACT|nr:hypothetical protein [Chitinophaga eiseniae]SKA39496.1 hypothetical protein SAMN04488128_1058 [Chitinophaga eiseniae]